MGKFLRLSNGIPRMVEETGLVEIYDERLTVVSSSPGAGEVEGPISTGTPITLPDSRTYVGLELKVFLNGQPLESVEDFTFEGSPPRTQISFNFDIEVGDLIRFRIDRAP
jgi:hypothetical protein